MDNNHQVNQKSYRREAQRRQERKMGVSGKSVLLLERLKRERAIKLTQKNAQGKAKK